MERVITREVWRTTGTVEIRHAPQAGQVSWRRAFVYPVAGGPRPGDAQENRAQVWRLSIEQFPEHNESGFWYGGRVQWHRDSTDRAEVETYAQRWVEFGTWP
jgi:hypothetical protein